MTEPFKVTRTWFVEADGPLDAIEKTKAGSGVPHDRADARPQVATDRDPSVTVVEVRTHRPDDYELIDHREQMRWVLKDGRWVERELPEREPAYRQAHEEGR